MRCPCSTKMSATPTCGARESCRDCRLRFSFAVHRTPALKELQFHPCLRCQLPSLQHNPNSSSACFSVSSTTATESASWNPYRSHTDPIRNQIVDSSSTGVAAVPTRWPHAAVSSGACARVASHFEDAMPCRCSCVPAQEQGKVTWRAGDCCCLCSRGISRQRFSDYFE